MYFMYICICFVLVDQFDKTIVIFWFGSTLCAHTMICWKKFAMRAIVKNISVQSLLLLHAYILSGTFFWVGQVFMSLTHYKNWNEDVSSGVGIEKMFAYSERDRAQTHTHNENNRAKIGVWMRLRVKRKGREREVENKSQVVSANSSPTI